MNQCPVCHKKGTLRRGRPAQGRERLYYAVCMTCGSYISVPFHAYFQLYSQDKPQKPATAKREMTL